MRLTCFILCKGDDVFVVAVDQFGESAGLVSAHADLVVLPFAGGDVLLQRHQPPEHQQNSALANISSLIYDSCACKLSKKVQLFSLASPDKFDNVN